MQKSTESWGSCTPAPLQSLAVFQEERRAAGSFQHTHSFPFRQACTYSWFHTSYPKAAAARCARGTKTSPCCKSPLTAFWKLSFPLVRGLQPRASTHSLPGSIRAQRLTYFLENCRPWEYQLLNTSRWNLQETWCGATGFPLSILYTTATQKMSISHVLQNPEQCTRETPLYWTWHQPKQHPVPHRIILTASNVTYIYPYLSIVVCVNNHI